MYTQKQIKAVAAKMKISKCKIHIITNIIMENGRAGMTNLNDTVIFDTDTGLNNKLVPYHSFAKTIDLELSAIEDDGSNEFPIIPRDNFQAAKIDLSNIKPFKDFTAKDITHGCLCGVYFSKNAIAATDGNCLLEHSTVNSHEFIISTQAIEILSMLKSESVEIGKKYFHVMGDGFEMYTKLVDGPYPNYEKVLPKNDESIFPISKEKLFAAIDKLAPLANDKTNMLFFQDEYICVSNEDNKKYYKINLGAKLFPRAMGFNCKILKTVLSQICEPITAIEPSSFISACVFKCSNKRAVIMPVRISYTEDSIQEFDEIDLPSSTKLLKRIK